MTRNREPRTPRRAPAARPAPARNAANKARLTVERLEERALLSTSATTMSAADFQQLVNAMVAFLSANHMATPDASTVANVLGATNSSSSTQPATPTPTPAPTTTPSNNTTPTPTPATPTPTPAPTTTPSNNTTPTPTPATPTASGSAGTGTATTSVPTVAQTSQPDTTTGGATTTTPPTTTTSTTTTPTSDSTAPASSPTPTPTPTPTQTTTSTTTTTTSNGPSISGFVYNDANNNGIMDNGEVGIGNNTIQLLDANGNVLATTTTDANGHYIFATNATVGQADLTRTETLNFPDATTNWTQSQALQKFDPTLGRLTSIDIVNHGTINSHIRVENLDQSAASVNAQASGTLALSGPGLSFTPLSSTQLTPTDASQQTFQAQAFDGATDYTGASGHDFGNRTASGSQSVTLTDPAVLAQYTGTGTLNFTATATATSMASGPGNLQSLINSTAGAQVTVTYHYTANNSLQPGNYVIHQPTTPSGYIPGQLTAGNVTPLPNSAGSNSIPVTLSGADSTNNNFGEIKTTSLSGFVYVDNDNDGIKQSGEAGISGATVTLSGTDDTGATISATRTTGGDGAYQFANLRPGTYSLKETVPAGYLDGKDTIGSQGGTAGDDQFTDIALTSGTNGTNNNFAEQQAASVSGFVYVDSNNNGIRDAGEPPIANVAIALTGTDSQGNDVALNTTTASDGSYKFANLNPGNYTITETQPAGFQEGRNSVGSLGGTVNGDQFQLAVNAGQQGVNYNYGELPPPAPAVASQGTPDQPIPQSVGVVTKRDSLMLFWRRRGITTTVDSL